MISKKIIPGEGDPKARLMLIGECPGEQEDREGRPFVGPAGKLLDRALEQAGLERKQTYITNAVKRFKWEPRGKRRIHKKPNSMEIAASKPQLEEEIQRIKPEIIVCLGATAAQALLGKDFRVTKQRGQFIPSLYAPYVMATVHPSSLLRAPDEDTRRVELDRLIDDLKRVHQVLYRKKIA